MRDQLQAVSRREDLLWHGRLLLRPNIILNGKCPEKVFEYLEYGKSSTQSIYLVGDIQPTWQHEINTVILRKAILEKQKTKAEKTHHRVASN